MTMWDCSCSRSGCPALARGGQAAQTWVVDLFPDELQVCRLHKTARQWQSCPAHWSNLYQFPPALLQSNGQLKAVRLRFCTQLCWAQGTRCAQWKGPVKCSAPAALKVNYNLPWKNQGMTVRCCFRASLIQNTWSFYQQALKTGMAQSFRQELQKQIPFPFQLVSLWSKGEFYPDTVPGS